jgi:hypothetical protein
MYRSTCTDLSIHLYVAALHFNLCSTWGINLITRPRYAGASSPQNPLNRGLGGSQNRSWRFGEKHCYSRTLLGSRLHRSVVNYVPVDTALSTELAPSLPKQFTPPISKFVSNVTIRLNWASEVRRHGIIWGHG